MCHRSFERLLWRRARSSWRIPRRAFRTTATTATSADAAHRVTLLATQDVAGKPLPDFDGSTWDPFAKKLLFTAELGANGGVWQASLDVPSQAQDISGLTGRAGYEGVQNDDHGNIYLVEDVGGTGGVTTPNAMQPNSFVYRVLPEDPTDLTKGGSLQALQVINGDHPITFHAEQNHADVLAPTAWVHRACEGTGLDTGLTESGSIMNTATPAA